MRLLTGMATLCMALPLAAETPLKPNLAAVGFLVGRWTSANGTVADTGGTSKGSSIITVDANGAALLRRDHTELFDAQGKSAGGFDQIMLIYSEGGGLRGEYFDGQHVIHYTSGAVAAGHSVTFSSTVQAGTPTFKLTYELKSADTLAITFGMTPPGETRLQPIAAGTLRRQ